jgi:hypothetical protein
MHLALIGFGMTLLGPYRDMRSRDDCRSLSGKADSVVRPGAFMSSRLSLAAFEAFVARDVAWRTHLRREECLEFAGCI